MESIYEDKVKKLVDIKNDGSFRLNQKYFNYATDLTMTNENLIIYLEENLVIQKKK